LSESEIGKTAVCPKSNKLKIIKSRKQRSFMNLEEFSKEYKHFCGEWADFEGYSPIKHLDNVSKYSFEVYCYEDTGCLYFWCSSENLLFFVDYCPLCGYKAPKPTNRNYFHAKDLMEDVKEVL
jgi:hypothetical protein